MGIKDYSGWRDEHVPGFILAGRIARRKDRERMCSCNEHFATRGELLSHCDRTQHKPLVELTIDGCLARQ